MNNLLRDETGLTESEFLAGYNSADFDRLSVSVDTVIFSIDGSLQNENIRKLDEQKLTVLLVKRDTHPFLGQWSLPGGFVRLDESPETAARRVLHDKTGLDDIYIEQLYTFGAPDRDPRMRIISCAYLSLIDRGEYSLSTSDKALQTAWFEIEFAKDSEEIILKSGDESLNISVKSHIVQNGKIDMLAYVVEDGSALAFDHASLILEGLLRLRGKTEYTDIVFNLMPEQFTISQLQQIYEIILGQKLLTPQFRRQIAPKVAGTDSYTGEKGHRPSQLFTYRGNKD